MESIKQKLAGERNPEEEAKMDEEIRSMKRSVAARKMVTEADEAIKAGLTEESRAALEARWKEEFPRLLAMVLDPGRSRAMLNAMLAQLEAVERGGKSTHDASVAVGTVLVNSYVRPKLGMEQVPLPDSGAPAPQSTGPHADP